MNLTHPDDKWHLRFLRLAQEVASWSKDPSTKVGCVLVGHDRREIHFGYNGFPSPLADSEVRLTDRAIRLAMTIHAEENAILNAQTKLVGFRAYVTRHPCANCAMKLIQVGIREVYYIFEEDFETRWESSLSIARAAFKEANVLCSPFHPYHLELEV